MICNRFDPITHSVAPCCAVCCRRVSCEEKERPLSCTPSQSTRIEAIDTAGAGVSPLYPLQRDFAREELKAEIRSIKDKLHDAIMRLTGDECRLLLCSLGEHVDNTEPTVDECAERAIIQASVEAIE